MVIDDENGPLHAAILAPPIRPAHRCWYESSQAARYAACCESETAYAPHGTNSIAATRRRTTTTGRIQACHHWRWSHAPSSVPPRARARSRELRRIAPLDCTRLDCTGRKPGGRIRRAVVRESRDLELRARWARRLERRDGRARMCPDHLRPLHADGPPPVG